MKKLKKWFIFLGTFLVSLVLLVFGITDFLDSRKFQSEGIVTTADVLDKDKHKSRKGASSNYYLTVSFETQAGETIVKRINVGYDTYQAASSGATRIKYLRSNPNKVQEINSSGISISAFIVSGIMLFISLFMFQACFQPDSLDQAPAFIVSKLKKKPYDPGQLVETTDEVYADLDKGFYDKTQRDLEQQGFRLLGKLESTNLKKQGNRMPMHFMVDSSNSQMAVFYHYNPPSLSKKLGSPELRVLDLESISQNGIAYLTTNNQTIQNQLFPKDVIISVMNQEIDVPEFLLVHQAKLNGNFSSDASSNLQTVQNRDELKEFSSRFNTKLQSWYKKRDLVKSTLQGLQKEVSNEDILNLIHQVDRLMASEATLTKIPETCPV